MKTLPQIAFDFNAADTIQQQPPVATAPNEEAAVNVGFRIKALKHQVVEPVREIEEEVLAPAPAAIKKPEAKINKIKSTRGRKSIKQTEAEADSDQYPRRRRAFKKQYYSIGEVAEMFRVNHSLLRYWENEFDIIQPRKNKKGDRHFRPVDIKTSLDL